MGRTSKTKIPSSSAANAATESADEQTITTKESSSALMLLPDNSNNRNLKSVLNLLSEHMNAPAAAAAGAADSVCTIPTTRNVSANKSASDAADSAGIVVVDDIIKASFSEQIDELKKMIIEATSEQKNYIAALERQIGVLSSKVHQTADFVMSSSSSSSSSSRFNTELWIEMGSSTRRMIRTIILYAFAPAVGCVFGSLDFHENAYRVSINMKALETVLNEVFCSSSSSSGAASSNNSDDDDEQQPGISSNSNSRGRKRTSSNSAAKMANKKWYPAGKNISSTQMNDLVKNVFSLMPYESNLVEDITFYKDKVSCTVGSNAGCKRSVWRSMSLMRFVQYAFYVFYFEENNPFRKSYEMSGGTNEIFENIMRIEEFNVHVNMNALRSRIVAAESEEAASSADIDNTVIQIKNELYMIEMDYKSIRNIISKSCHPRFSVAEYIELAKSNLDDETAAAVAESVELPTYIKKTLNMDNSGNNGGGSILTNDWVPDLGGLKNADGGEIWINDYCCRSSEELRNYINVLEGKSKQKRKRIATNSARSSNKRGRRSSSSSNATNNNATNDNETYTAAADNQSEENRLLSKMIIGKEFSVDWYTNQNTHFLTLVMSVMGIRIFSTAKCITNNTELLVGAKCPHAIINDYKSAVMQVEIGYNRMNPYSCMMNINHEKRYFMLFVEMALRVHYNYFSVEHERELEESNNNNNSHQQNNDDFAVQSGSFSLDAIAATLLRPHGNGNIVRWDERNNEKCVKAVRILSFIVYGHVDLLPLSPMIYYSSNKNRSNNINSSSSSQMPSSFQKKDFKDVAIDNLDKYRMSVGLEVTCNQYENISDFVDSENLYL